MTTSCAADTAPVRAVRQSQDSRRWLALAVIAAAALMVVLDVSIINIALPDAQTDLGISVANRPWAITAYALTFGGLLLLGGRIGDVIGRKKALLIGLAGFAAASALGGLAPDGGLLFGARAAQGVFAALLAPATLALIATTFADTGERAKAFGVYGAVQGAGGAIGVVLGGVLTEYVSWRWCLFVNVPLAIAVGLAAVWTVSESSSGPARSYDLPGAALVTVGVASIVFAFAAVAEPGQGWAAPRTVLFFLAGAVLLVVFVAVEHRAEQPLLPLRVVTDRGRGGAYVTGLLTNGGMFGLLLIVTFYLQINLGYSPLVTGLAFLPFSGGIIVSAFVASALLPKVGPKPLMLAGTVIGTLGLLWLITLNADSSFGTTVLPTLVLVSVGLGSVFVPMSSMSLHAVDPVDTGVASAMLSTVNQLGGAIGAAVINSVYAAVVAATSASVANQVDGYRMALIVAGSMLAIAVLVVAALVPRGAGRMTDQ